MPAGWMNKSEIQSAVQDDKGQVSQSERPRSIFSVPRRFDLATVLVVTTAYSILLGGFSGLHAHPLATVSVAGFVTLIGLGQALLFRGRKPRLSSILVGIFVFECCFGLMWFQASPPDLSFALLFSLIAVAYGVILGYLTGTLIGGVFLLADVIRRRNWGRMLYILLMATTLVIVGAGAVTLALTR
jgi:hypothetical protein